MAVTTGTVAVRFNEARLANEAETDLETIFCAEYKRIARVIARVTRDPARAEELAVEVFLKWGRTPNQSTQVPRRRCFTRTRSQVRIL